MPRHLPDWIGSYLQYTENSEPPDLYKEWIAISVIAAALQRKCYLNWGPLTFYPNLYIVLVGPSGRCRKGTAMGVGAEFLRGLGVKLAAEAITREALIQEVSAASGHAINPETELPEMHASLTVYSQELTVFLGYDNKQLIADLTDWYDCRERWTYRTKNMGTDDILGVWVNLIGATTPELIQTALPHDAIGGGLASRIIFVFEENKGKVVALPFLDVEDAELREKLAYDLEDIHLMSGPFRYTEDFIEAYLPWYLEQDRNPPFQDNSNFQGYIQRRPNHVMKLCVILSASSRADRIIDAKILKRAIDLLERTEVKMSRTFAGYGTARHAAISAKIMTHIARVGRIRHRRLLADHYADLEYGTKTLDDIIHILKQMEFLKTEQIDNETWYVFNPDSNAGKAYIKR